MRFAPLLRIALLLLGGYLLLLGLAFLGQRKMIYFPARTTPEASDARARRLRLEPWREAAGGRLGWVARHPSGTARGTVLVLHGNAGSALDRTYLAEVFQGPAMPMALDVFLLEYPGYGAREGTPSEDALVAAATAAIEVLQARGRPVVLCGESLGGAVACLAAARRPESVSGLILIAPLKSLPAVARRHYPYLPPILLRDRFQADRALAAFRGPAAFLIAGQDEVVFPDLCGELRDAHAGPHRTWTEPGATHNGLTFDPRLPRWGEMAAFALEGR